MRRKSHFTPLIVTCLALLTLAACSGSTLPESSNPPASGGQGNGNLAFDFPITVYQGESVLGAETIQYSDLLAQGKPVVLNFWAGLCPPCRVEMPDLQEVYEAYQDQVLLLGLDVGTFTALGTQEDGQALLAEVGVTYPAGTTPEAMVMQEFRVVGMPSTYFISPDGEIVNTWAGLLTRDKMEELVAELLAASGQ